MWFLKSWIYKSRYGKIAFKMHNFTQSFQQECRESIKEEFKSITSKLPNIWTRIQLKAQKQLMHENFVDILGDLNPVRHPLFSENEVAKFTQNRVAYVFVLLLMVIFESILYSMMATLFIKRQTLKDFTGIEFIFGFAFALIFVAALHFAFKKLWEFWDAKCIIEVKKLDKTRLKPFYINLVISIIILIVFVVTNIYTGFIRATILEPSSTGSSSFIDKIHGPLLVFSIAITFIVALVMALLEKEISDRSEKYKVYKNWKRQKKELKIYNTQIKEMLKSCQERKNILTEKYWGILKDLQRVFNLEVDANRLPLYDEFNEKLSRNEIDLNNIDDKIYQYYLPIAVSRHELFKYGIDTDKYISETIIDLQNKVEIIEQSEKFKMEPDKKEKKTISEISE